MKRLSSLFIFLLAACATAPKNLTTAEGTMAEGERLLKDEFYEEARNQFYRIKTEFPQSSLQLEADLKIAESYFLDESYVAAATAYEDFIRTYPGRKEIPMALNQLGQCYLRQMPATPQRDTRATIKVVDVFTRLMIDYPNSEYAATAPQYIEKARNQLASKIFDIAKFYERSGDYGAAVRRFEELQNQYPDSTLVEEAMARQVRCLKKDGKTELADKVGKDFQEKFPKSQFATMIAQ
jgi:outer membrane protein assembly factor BamD